MKTAEEIYSKYEIPVQGPRTITKENALKAMKEFAGQFRVPVYSPEWKKTEEYENPITYRQLKERLDKFSEEQLNQSAAVIVVDNSHADSIYGIDPIGRDIYVHKDDDEDGGTLEELKDYHGDDFNESDYVFVTPSTRIFIWAE